MKRNAILLQEAYRRDGHADFIKRTSEVCGVPRSTLKKWRQQHLNGIYTEVTNDDKEFFRVYVEGAAIGSGRLSDLWRTVPGKPPFGVWL